MAVVEGPAREAVRRLAQYRPFDEGGQSLEAMVQDLLLAATALNGGGFHDLVVCQTGFRDLWGLEVELDELRTARDALCQAGSLTRVRGGFALTEEAREKLEQRAATSAENEAEALSDWREALTALRPDLTDHDFECLCQDLGEWLNRVILRHGVEAALLLYPEDERAHKLFEEVDALGTSFLPWRAGIAGQIREEAFRRFVRQATPAQRTFLANRMNTAFYLTVLTLDPAAKGLVQERAQGRRIYLDTNFLYAVLGKAPAREVSSAHRLLALTKELGIEIAVTPWTVEELRVSIQNARRNAQRLPLRREFAQVVLVGAGEKGYSAAFWRDYHKTGVRPQDWFDRAAHFEEDLKQLGIGVIDKGCAAVDQNEALVDEYAGLLSRVLGLGRERHEEVLEHDAKHRLLIERLRGKGHISFSNARFWFLTQDNKLPRFARQMPDPDEDAPELPFCISSSSWVQIVRALTPRTEDFDETVVTLLTSPYVGYRPPLESRTVREVVARMDTYEDASPELAIAVLEDTALVRDIEDASDEEIEERVRAAYSGKTRELQEQARASREAAEAQRREREAAEARERDALREVEAERRRREGAETDAERERRKRDEAERRADAAIAEERAKREQLEKDAAERKRRGRKRRRLIFGAVLVATAIVAPLVLVYFDKLGGVVTPVVVTCTALVLMLLGIRIALGARWGGEIVNWIFGVVGIIGTALSVIAIVAAQH